MKKIILSVAITSLSTLFAQSTICYVQNITNPSMSEVVALNGGKCAGVKSAQDMQNDGWEVNDIKISSGKDGMDYTFVFKKGVGKTTVDTTLSEEEMMQRIMARMNAQQKQKAKEAKIKKEIMTQERIKAFYIKRCQTCHGEKGELRAKGTSRPLNTLSVNEMNKAILGYSMDTYDRGLAMVMIPYTSFATDENLEDIYTYLQSFKKDTKDTKK